jgi:hypothetical protein
MNGHSRSEQSKYTEPKYTEIRNRRISHDPELILQTALSGIEPELFSFKVRDVASYTTGLDNCPSRI